jgi:hypothetical protein
MDWSVALTHTQDIWGSQMAKLFISPYRPEDWTGSEWKVQINFQIEPAILAESVKGRWPEAEVQINHAPDPPVEWTFPSQFWGWLQSNRDTVVFTDGPEQSFVEFTLWYRTFVRPSIRLFLMDEWSERSLELTVETTAKEITDFTGH